MSDLGLMLCHNDISFCTTESNYIILQGLQLFHQTCVLIKTCTHFQGPKARENIVNVLQLNVYLGIYYLIP